MSTGALTEYRLKLVSAGFRPICVEGKRPPEGMIGWDKCIDANAEEISSWEQFRNSAKSTGIFTRWTPALDIDIRDELAAEAIESLARDYFCEHGNFLVRFGLAPKRAIPLRSSVPFGKLFQLFTAPNGDKHKIEILGDGQQLVVNGIHPDTHQPYRWVNGEPGNVAASELPEITEAQALQFLADASEILKRDFDFTIVESRRRKRTKTNGADEPGAAAADWGALAANIIAGHALHDNLLALAGKFVKSGMSRGAAINMLRGLMQKSEAPRDDRWQERYDDIPRLVETADEPGKIDAPAGSLADAHKVFRKWLGKDYDLDTVDAMMAVAAAERLTGDPPWLLIISGSGNAKTETVQATSGLGAHVVSSITSEAALLSASPRKQRAKDATGGLLKKIGARGILAIKDFTSILSMDRNIRASVLAALREVHDGSWVRNVGVDGGQTLRWSGRVIVIGACTTSWDQAHAVIASMGDRFITIRSNSHEGRLVSGEHAMRNTGKEDEMRKELSGAVASVIAGVDPANVYELTQADRSAILRVADVVTLARTGVELDYRGDVIDAHQPEMPTRLSKQLCQVMRAAIAIGMGHDEAMRLVIRCAKDSMPQLRLMVLLDIDAHPDAKVIDVRRRLQKPRATIDRTLQALHFLGLLTCREEEITREGKPIQARHYSVAGDISLAPLSVPEM